MKLLPIPTCQRIVAGQRIGPGVYDGGRPRLCGIISVAVIRYDDGQERFVCAEHQAPEAEQAEPWRLHRRNVAAGPMAVDRDGRRSQRHVVVPKLRRWVPTAEQRANMSAGQRERRERERASARSAFRRSA